MAEITRLFSTARLEMGAVLPLSEEEGRHIFKVLRARAGDVVEVVDGAERLFAAEITDKRETVIREERPAAGSADGDITLYQAVPKGRHMDLVVEKATEIGVNRVVPLSTQRGVVRLPEGDGKVLRWRRVAEAAARQSLRFRIPEVTEVVSFREAACEAGETGVILHNEPSLSPLEDVVTGPAVGLFVGPEGGWSDDELAAAGNLKLRSGSLGPYRLRSETAGMAAVARASAVLERTRSVGRSG